MTRYFKLILVFSFCFFLYFIDNPTSMAIDGDYRSSMLSGGNLRTYLVHLPAGYSPRKKYPLLIALHGRLGNGKGTVELTHFNQVADNKSFIVVYPDGLFRSWADGRGVTPADKRNINDVSFLKALMDKLSIDFSIDSTRVYATGISNGGFMAQRLACELPNYLSGIAVVSANMTEYLAQTCNPRRTIPVIFFNGTDDPFSPFNGGVTNEGSVLSSIGSARQWAKLNGCNLAPVDFPLADRVNDQTSVVVESYKKCRSGSPVTSYIIKGGGHTWPGGKQHLPIKMVGVTSREIDASQVIWDFFTGR